MNKILEAIKEMKITCPDGEEHVGNTYCHDCDCEDPGFATWGVEQVTVKILDLIIAHLQERRGHVYTAAPEFADKLEHGMKAVNLLKGADPYLRGRADAMAALQQSLKEARASLSPHTKE